MNEPRERALELLETLPGQRGLGSPGGRWQSEPPVLLSADLPPAIPLPLNSGVYCSILDRKISPLVPSPR